MIDHFGVVVVDYDLTGWACKSDGEARAQWLHEVFARIVDLDSTAVSDIYDLPLVVSHTAENIQAICDGTFTLWTNNVDKMTMTQVKVRSSSDNVYIVGVTDNTR